ncbi:MAG TPA: TonB-dependent receptor [Nevskiaceae bacterium]|nr:TonB-dependent receptor [Nevskiaceae bacterium]
MDASTSWGLDLRRVAVFSVLVAGFAAARADETPPPDANGEAVLGEVVVTARKKQERAQDVPIALSVLDGKSLAEANLTLPTDIQERAPGLVVSVPNARLTSYTIRGLGSSSANDGIESSVGLFLDGVYLGRQGLSIFDLIDLDRVEILRGPQGTLFGKNTTAGAISIVTKAPSFDRESRVEGTLGSLDARQVRGSINGPILNGVLAGRLTGYWTQRDGTIHDVYNDKLLNDRRKRGLRGQLLWAPALHLTGRFIAEYGFSDEECCAFPLRAPVSNNVVQRDAYMEYTRIGTDAADRVTDSDAPTRSDMRQKAVSAEFNWDFADNKKLTSVTAWRDWHFVPLNDDGTSLKLASTSTLNQHQQISQELRVSVDYGFVDGVAGVYLLHQQLDGLERVILGEDITGWVFGGEIRKRALPNATESSTGLLLYTLIPKRALDGLTVDTAYFQRTESAAAFASANWHLSPRIDLTTGLRYTYEWKAAHVHRTRYGGDPSASPLSTADPVLPVLDALFPQFKPVVCGTDVVCTDFQSVGFNGIIDDVAGGEYARENRFREGNYSGQLALSYKLSRDALAYASIARGYKGGGINLGFVGESIQPTFRPEQATSYEIGAKARLFRALALSTAIYQTDVKDYQALTFDNENTLLPNPRQINLLNVGRVRLRGVELEGYGYAASWLMLRGGAAFSRAVTTEFPDAPNEDTRANDKNLSGETLYNAPKWTATAGAELSNYLDNGTQPFAGIDYSYRSGYWGTVEHGRASYIDGYDLWNLRVGLRSADRLWDLSFWMRNVLGKDYIAFIYPLYGVGDYGAAAADPRTFGATLRMEFR